MKHSEKYNTKSAEETQDIGRKLAKDILKSRLKKSAVVLALQGDLGAGKTTFLQGFGKGLGIKEKILSPTFVILKRFKITKIKNQNAKFKMTIQNSKFTNFYHFDLYRINNSREILDLGFKGMITNPENIIAIEWPEKIKRAIPKNAVKIKFEHQGGTHRKLTIIR